MKILDLVIVDDEPILLKGLESTYDWEQMGFRIVGTAMNGEQAIQVIREKKPQVVITDIRMKQMTGLEMMDVIRKSGQKCLFVVISAYRDFEYAQEAIKLGAFEYLLKPIEDDKLFEVMKSAYRKCIDEIETAQNNSNWENIVRKDSLQFTQLCVQRFLQNSLSLEKLQEVFESFHMELDNEDRFIALKVDVDLSYKIINEIEYEALRFSAIQYLNTNLEERFSIWRFEAEDGAHIYIVRTTENSTVHEIKNILEEYQVTKGNHLVASMSKPYKGIIGIRRSYQEAVSLFSPTRETENGLVESLTDLSEREGKINISEEEAGIFSALRKNDSEALKTSFVSYLYCLPDKEEAQRQMLHSVMVQAEGILENGRELPEEIRKSFRNYYSNMEILSAAKTVDVCYHILKSAVESRTDVPGDVNLQKGKEYMKDALRYIDEHLNEEDLSIVAVATHVYLNPVYFGRVFKETVDMSFKKYLLQCRMEKAKRLIRSGDDSIGSVCEQIGISNPSYFAHLFKEYTGKLPSEYKKEIDA